jgi:hypothetical protein
MAEPGREIDYAEWALKWRWANYEDFFADPILALALCHYRESNRKALIALARAGHPRARASLWSMAQFLTAAGDPLPRWLQEYFFALPRSTRKRGRDPVANLVRNGVIWQTVNFVAQAYRIRPTRSETNCHRSSACSIVGEALARIGIHMTEANVVAIWQRFRADDLLYRRRKAQQLRDVARLSERFAQDVLDEKIASADSNIINDYVQALEDVAWLTPAAMFVLNNPEVHAIYDVAADLDRAIAQWRTGSRMRFSSSEERLWRLRFPRRA